MTAKILGKRLEKIEAQMVREQREKANMAYVAELIDKYRDRESDLSLDPNYDENFQKNLAKLKERRNAHKKSY